MLSHFVAQNDVNPLPNVLGIPNDLILPRVLSACVSDCTIQVRLAVRFELLLALLIRILTERPIWTPLPNTGRSCALMTTTVRIDLNTSLLVLICSGLFGVH